MFKVKTNNYFRDPVHYRTITNKMHSYVTAGVVLIIDVEKKDYSSKLLSVSVMNIFQMKPCLPKLLLK